MGHWHAQRGTPDYATIPESKGTYHGNVDHMCTADACMAQALNLRMIRCTSKVSLFSLPSGTAVLTELVPARKTARLLAVVGPALLYCLLCPNKLKQLHNEKQATLPLR